MQYVVEGSVRKAGNRVRITVQLIDAGPTATSGRALRPRPRGHLRDPGRGHLGDRRDAARPHRGGVARPRGAQDDRQLAAYELVLASKLLHHRSSRADNDQALALLDRAIALDPNFGHAHAWKACTLGQRWGYHWCDDRRAFEPLILAELQTALALDDNDNDVHRILAAINLVYEIRPLPVPPGRALNLNQNDDLVVVQQARSWPGPARRR